MVYELLLSMRVYAEQISSVFPASGSCVKPRQFRVISSIAWAVEVQPVFRTTPNCSKRSWAWVGGIISFFLLNQSKRFDKQNRCNLRLHVWHSIEDWPIYFRWISLCCISDELMVRGRIGSEIEIERTDQLPCDYEHLFCFFFYCWWQGWMEPNIFVCTYVTVYPL